MRLQDKVAIVVGGGAGMGRAVALAFGREGAKVVVVDVDAASGSSCAQEIVDSGAESLFVHTDIADTTQVQAMVSAAVDRFHRVDVLHVNAGIQSRWEDKRAHELGEEFCGVARVVAQTLLPVRTSCCSALTGGAVRLKNIARNVKRLVGRHAHSSLGRCYLFIEKGVPMGLRGVG